MKEPEIKLTGHNMNVIVTNDLKSVAIHCNEVVSRNGKSELSGRDILLQMTPKQAMHLLALLQAVQSQCGFEAAPGTPEGIAVPPAKDRN